MLIQGCMARVFENIKDKNKNMNMLVYGDFHGHIPRMSKKAISKNKIELILCSGDYGGVMPEFRDFQLKNNKEIRKLMKKGMTWQKALEKLLSKKNIKYSSNNDDVTWMKAIKKITAPGKLIISVFGNTDNYVLLKNKTKNIENFKLLDGNVINYNNYRIIGIGDYIRPSKKALKDKIKRYENKIEGCLKKESNKKIIVISHYPPYGILDKVKGNHTGLNFLLYIIKKYKPLLFICGHIHEEKGMIKFNDTFVINAGMAKEGGILIKIRQTEILFDYLR